MHSVFSGMGFMYSTYVFMHGFNRQLIMFVVNLLYVGEIRGVN